MATKNNHGKLFVAASVAAVLYLCRDKITAAIASATAPAAAMGDGASCTSSAPPITAAAQPASSLQGLHPGQIIWIRGRYRL
jgi:hypothetical protein